MPVEHTVIGQFMRPSLGGKSLTTAGEFSRSRTAPSSVRLVISLPYKRKNIPARLFANIDLSLIASDATA
jgi:hypothetical protein